jgi:hypothetical protein
MLSIQQFAKNRTTTTTSLFFDPYTGGINACDPVVAVIPQQGGNVLVGVIGILG